MRIVSPHKDHFKVKLIPSPNSPNTSVKLNHVQNKKLKSLYCRYILKQPVYDYKCLKSESISQ